MPSKVLIVDDDRDFNQLLTSVYVQGGYDAVAVQSAKAALDRISRDEFQLIVIDHMMPGATGLELLTQLREVDRHTPVIIVSGVLSDETIRSYIKLGVGGIFSKPINIFTLLRKTRELLLKVGSEADGALHQLTQRSEALPFAFYSFGCKAPAAIQFAHELYNHRSFAKRLLLQGPQGTHFEMICDDLRNFRAMGREELVTLHKRGDASGDNLEGILASQQRHGIEAVMLLIPDVTLLTDKDAANISAAINNESPYKRIPVNTRAVFCCQRLLEDLYNESLICREVYELASTDKIQVPSLAKVPEDIPLMAEAILANIAISEDQPRAQLTEEVMRYLMTRDWAGNYVELNRVIRLAREMIGTHVITLEDVVAADQFGGNKPRKILPYSLQQHLQDCREDYVQAILSYNQRDYDATAKMLGLSPEFVRRIAEK